jgi:hypothetical protein
MGYLAAWKILEEMIIEFRKKGVEIPSKVMNNLKSARTMIKILMADPCRGETMQKIEEYLGNVESYLISEGQKKFGVQYVDKWLQKLDKANKEIVKEEEKAARFVPGIPKENKWIRIKPTSELPIEKVKEMAEQSNLSYNIQNDGCLVVYGKDSQIKEFVKKMATKYEAKARK